MTGYQISLKRLTQNELYDGKYIPFPSYDNNEENTLSTKNQYFIIHMISQRSRATKSKGKTVCISNQKYNTSNERKVK